MKDGCMHMYKIAIFFKRDFSFALGSYCENALFLHGVSRSGEKEKKPISYLVIVLSLYKPLGGGEHQLQSLFNQHVDSCMGRVGIMIRV